MVKVNRCHVMPVVLIISVILLAAAGSLAADAPVQKTGQTICYDASGASIACTGTGHDGDLKKGVAWPNPRFTDNSNGTVTDNLTGLIWLKDVSCAALNGTRSDKNSALTKANSLNNGQCSLSDNSSAGDWRLPNVRELESMIHAEFSYPALPNTAGTGQWTTGNPFLFPDTTGIFDTYWTSTLTTLPPGDIVYWSMDLGVGKVFQSSATSTYILWPVKGESAAPAPAPVAKTGQTASDPGGASRDDGELKKGVALLGARFATNNDGTLTDVLTGLVWLRNANCAVASQTWAQALQAVANLNSTGAMDQTNCGDGSNGGSHQTDWRLPNRRELLSLIDFGKFDPALPVNDFVSIELNDLYWTSTSLQSSTFEALTLDLGSGRLSSDSKDQFHFVWAVRGESTLTPPLVSIPVLQGPYLLLLLDSQ